MPRRLLVVGALLVGMTGTAILVSTSRGRPSDEGGAVTDHSAIAQGDTLQVPRDEGPLPSGQKTSISEAESKLGYHLYRPDHKLANDAAIQGVYLASPQNEEGSVSYRVAIDYDSGILLYIDPVSNEYEGFRDPATQYERMASGINTGIANGSYPSGTTAEVVTVLGTPALLTESFDGHGGVDLVLNGFRIQMFAEYAAIDAATLLDVAGSIG